MNELKKDLYGFIKQNPVWWTDIMRVFNNSSIYGYTQKDIIEAVQELKNEGRIKEEIFKDWPIFVALQ